MFYLTCGMYIVAVVLGELGALLSHEKKMMLPAWYPFDWQHSTWKYFIVHLHQSVALILYVLQNVSNDTFPAIYMLVLKSHVKTLNIRIRRLGLDTTESSQVTCAELIQCIQDQQMLVEYFHTVRKATSAAIFLQFFVTGMEACIIAVCVFFVENNLFETIFFAEYFLCVILEIFLYCYFGEQLASESDRMTEAIYSCNWMGQDRRFKQNLIIFMQSTQTNMTIIAGGIFKVNLSTFVTVLKSPYSLFAVLTSRT
ncbi:odorant receptor 59a-like [Hermetia illucens]|nr:odorant receptor 59a-like [Hermetia illucens]